MPLIRSGQRVGTAVQVCGRFPTDDFEELALEIEGTRFWLRAPAVADLVSVWARDDMPLRYHCGFGPVEALILPFTFATDLGMSGYGRRTIDFRPTGAFLLGHEDGGRFSRSKSRLSARRQPGQTTWWSFDGGGVTEEMRVLDHISLEGRWSPPLHRALPVQLRLENETLHLKAIHRDRPVVVYVAGQRDDSTAIRLEVRGDALAFPLPGRTAQLFAAPNAVRGFLVGPPAALEARRLTREDQGGESWLQVSSNRDLVARLDKP